MTLCAVLAGASLLAGSRARLSAATAVMSVDDIRPGMVGIGHTVFDGTHVEEFR
jgi:hypothetical protein